MGNGKSVEQQRFGHGEDRRVRRDRQGERRVGDEREAGASAQYAGGEDQIAQQHGRDLLETLSEKRRRGPGPPDTPIPRLSGRMEVTMGRLGQDIRYAVRTAVRTPSVSIL